MIDLAIHHTFNGAVKRMSTFSCQRFKKLRMRDIIVRMISMGEVAKRKPLLLYTQIIIQGNFSKLGMYLAIKGRTTNITPIIMRAMPTNVKG